MKTASEGDLSGPMTPSHLESNMKELADASPQQTSEARAVAPPSQHMAVPQGDGVRSYSVNFMTN